MKHRFIKHLLLCIFLFAGTKAEALEAWINGIHYVLEGNMATVTYSYFSDFYQQYFSSYSGSVIIPDSVTYSGKAYCVKYIGDYAFSNSDKLTSVTIPKSVISIGQHAFYRCSDLTSVIIPNSVTYIGSGAFYGCRSLTSITIPYNITYISSESFYYCESLTSITIPEGVRSIGNSAFSDCYNLTSVTIPNTVTSIGNVAFDDCHSLNYVAIPNSVTNIGDGAFQHCSSLAAITIPDGITDIRGWTFNGCRSLSFITVPNSVTTIGEYAFIDCRSLISITIPNNVTSIGDFAFTRCQSLTSITIPNNVTSIGTNAFSFCSGLTSAVIGENVTSLGTSVFYGCPFLPGSFINNSALTTNQYGCRLCDKETSDGLLLKDNIVVGCRPWATSIVIPNSIKTIEEKAFSYCTNLTDITIPSSMKNFRGNVIYNCTSLTDVYCYAENVPNAYSNPFYNSPVSSATLHVPEASLKTYSTKSPWGEFGSIVPLVECARPTIEYVNGKLRFNCETEGVTYKYHITDEDIKSGTDDEVNLTVTYQISVFAQKEGYDNSEETTATLCWIDVEPQTEGIEDAVTEVKALPVLIQTQGCTITVQGADDGTPITIYGTDGKMYGSAASVNGIATLNTSLRPGSVAVVKIGEKSIKVLMK